MSDPSKLIVLSGPSCIGKSPLVKALAQFYPELSAKLQPLVLHNSRSPRPGECEGKDYYFHQREEVEQLRKKENFVVIDVRGDLQALDLVELHQLLKKGDVIFEGNPFIGHTLLTHPKLVGIRRVSTFISPLSHEELNFLKTQPGVLLEKLVTDVMRRKLLRRTQRQKTILSLKDLEEIERRAGSAFRELAMAHQFEHVLVNHDGEDSENWNAFYFPLGDARKTLLAFAALLQDLPTSGLEHWEASFLASE